MRSETEAGDSYRPLTGFGAKRWGGVFSFTLVWLICIFAATAASAIATKPLVTKEIHSGLSAVMENGLRLYLQVILSPDESEMDFLWKSFLAAPESAHDKLTHSIHENGEVTFLLPFEALDAPSQLLVISTLFPDDRREEGAWVHTVRYSDTRSGNESLWAISHWFTGDGQIFPELIRANELKSRKLVAGQVIRIPNSLLLSTFKPAETERGRHTVRTNGDLVYDSDRKGPFAVYRLKRGEALYSSVVIRFTGRTEIPDVKKASVEIADRSNITNVRNIPVGYPVKIPLELLAPEYLPPEDPRRLQYEETRRSAEAYKNPERTSNLLGVSVILDAGHGGKDVGTLRHGLGEDDFVYDVMCRLKRLLETETSAEVIPIIRDESIGFEPQNVREFERDEDETILTTPPYRPNDTRTGVNFRWYLANYHYRRLVREGVDPRRILFLSLHADSLHADLRGAMIYIPGAEFRRGRYGRVSGIYKTRVETRDQPVVSFSKRERLESEGLSRELAQSLLSEFESGRIRVADIKPIREYVIRGSAWLPAVLQCNQVPAKVLIEICNLNNPSDAKLIIDPDYRERCAASIVRALVSYYGETQLAQVSAAR